MSRYVLLYSEACSKCTRYTRWIKRLDIFHRIRPVPLGTIEATKIIMDYYSAEPAYTYHLVDLETETIYSGSKAVPRLIRALTLGQ